MGEPIRLLLADGATRKFSLRVRQSPAARPFSLILPESDTEAAVLASVSEADAASERNRGIAGHPLSASR